MSFTNHTPNYNLPQYVGTDKPTFLGDFNNAMSAIDTALHNNAQNAGEGLSELQQAQAALTETQETLTEVQTEVANVSGIASTVNQNVQQALTAANDATTAANNATSQIQPAVTAANQASADAQAAQQVANGNVTTLNDLSERVSVLEEASIKNYTLSVTVTAILPIGINTSNNGTSISIPEGQKVSAVRYKVSNHSKSLPNPTLNIQANSKNLINEYFSSCPTEFTNLNLESAGTITSISVTQQPNNQNISGAAGELVTHIEIDLIKS